MRLVIDTNILVSGLLTPRGASSRLLREYVLVGEPKLLYDDRVLSEYEEVLRRPRLRLHPLVVGALCAGIRREGESVACAPVGETSPDPDDRPFLEVAICGQADALVTFNPRHFPDTRGIPVVTSRQVLALLEGDR